MIELYKDHYLSKPNMISLLVSYVEDYRTKVSV